jgi:hypothetical protein
MLVDEGAGHGSSVKEHRHQCRSGTMPMGIRMIRSTVAEPLENLPREGHGRVLILGAVFDGGG